MSLRSAERFFKKKASSLKFCDDFNRARFLGSPRWRASFPHQSPEEATAPLPASRTVLSALSRLHRIL
jgi:hypothetical protein